MKPLYLGIPDARSLNILLDMGYAITPMGAAWPSNSGWKKPDGSAFPIPALLIKIASKWRPDGVKS
jgi:hypothetical protein